MSQNQASEQHPTADQHAMQHVDAAHADSPYLLEWGYSGKAMRASNLLLWIITLACIGLTVYLTMIGNQLAGKAFMPTWIAVVAVLLVLWICFCILYFYRTCTIKYRLTTHSLDTHKGFFTRRWDTMELINVEDIAVHTHLFDRIINGGVGTITVHSKTDKTHENGVELIGIENPQEVFLKIKQIRDDIRAKRALIS